MFCCYPSPNRDPVANPNAVPDPKPDVYPKLIPNAPQKIYTLHWPKLILATRLLQSLLLLLLLRLPSSVFYPDPDPCP